jgi:glycosyltransferase involved in cell wall biosynthesis
LEIPEAMSSPLVSVIIPAYNQGHYLGKAIQSVLDQTYPSFEVLVVDDGSTDDTAVVTRQFADARVRYIYKDNGGLSSARNTGVRNSSGEFLTYLDSDDLFLPTKLSLLVEALQARPEAGFAAGQSIPIDENEQPISTIFDTPIPEDTRRLVLGNPLHVGSVMVRRDWQARAGEFDESLRSYEDWDMWLRLARLGCPMIYVPEPVSLYRFHTAQMTRIGQQMTTATFAVLDKLYSDPELPSEWLELKDLAYSNANLRAMAQAYLGEDFRLGQQYLCAAVGLNPDLMENNADALAKRLFALAFSPKNQNPVQFLETIYGNLPDEFEALSSRSAKDLSRAAVDNAFEAYARKDYVAARNAARRALFYEPGWLKNRGLTAVLIKAYTRPFFEYIFSS